ncbi:MULTISPECIES: winged helix-turn-helix transcriptional regulator [Clostridium]|jgi:Predicted transcriptional regulators|nr:MULTISPECIES: helix-turn-helix domain-containing protein [Clostridium]AVK47653.1 HxlR family transcriptional regulator [Clostridium sp. MF28]NRT69608.1 DNA-binding HxlR family transcriptional regulator [Clostridium beijerinckii]NRT84247.1 DNA-binding HxlR family transcriptional regulator [Clostridium beijerinckii]NRU49197.1 DNA-binding HxlR family transcriptional regulator [Clostridium beijerinckii]NRZ32801.1 DNA-binding HxlR family transcriptional regulator [Clostridium beijerinckii]
MASKQELEKYLNIVRESDFSEKCPIKDALEVIGGKWKLNILGQLLRKDVCRFNQLKRDVSGITNTMLANSLRELENDELIIRNQYNEMPVRVEYTLTDKGRNLLPLLYELTIWWEDYIKNKEISK